MQKEISTKIGIAIIVVCSLLIFGAVMYQDKESKQYIENDSSISLEQENPSLEEEIEALLEREFPQLKAPGFDVTVEINKGDHAIGKYAFNSYKNTIGEGVWFATKKETGWVVINTSYVGYNGNCQKFKEYSFPPDLTPDCWDNEKKVLVDTTNPEMFYKNGFTKADKKEIINSFSTFVKKDPNSWAYLNKELYVRVSRNTESHLRGTILIGGSENISAPYFLAVKVSGMWKFVFTGQDIPPCSTIEPYDFPEEIIDTCYDEINKQEKKVITK